MKNLKQTYQNFRTVFFYLLAVAIIFSFIAVGAKNEFMALVSVIANIVAGVCFFIWIALYISHCIIKAVFEERDERQIGGIATIKNHKIAIILLKKY